MDSMGARGWGSGKEEHSPKLARVRVGMGARPCLLALTESPHWDIQELMKGRGSSVGRAVD